jgi:hypothetical protein
MKPLHRRRLTFVAGFTAYFLALWVLWPTMFVYPLKIFVVFLHELSHAVAGVATGGRVESITLDPNQGGATYVRGGNGFIMLSAGYLGSLLWGLLLLEAARARPKTARLSLCALACLMLVVTALFVRSWFGVVFGLLFGLVLLFAGRRLPGDGIVVVLTVLGLTSALYALFDIRDDIIARPTAPSDAFMLAQATGIPTLVWGGLWGLIALVACGWMLRKMWRTA